jgi:oxygen-independent coproporphyrinogen-3 oxidase
VSTCFIGGGTPTCLDVPQLQQLLVKIRQSVGDQPVEFTVEANPGTLDLDKVTLLSDHGVNRISLGVQSFRHHELHTLGRIHREQAIDQSLELISRCGFAHLNLDLIFAVPGQSADSWRDTVKRAVASGADHLACYGLTYEPDTPMFDMLEQGRLSPVSENLQIEMYQLADEILTDAGFDHYEISNYARPGGHCQHNLRYWQNLDTLGAGPAAASYIGGVRTRNVPDIEQYIRLISYEENAFVDREKLTPAQRAGETAMLNLRLTAGIDVKQFEERTGFDPHHLFAEAIRVHEAQGRLQSTPSSIRLTAAGRLVADQVMADFLNPDAL